MTEAAHAAAGLGPEPALALGLALLLGLRHATDPDHLTALLTLVASGERNGVRRAGALGLCWGLGHALTCSALGLATLWAGSALPVALVRGAEVAVGLLIVALAARLLWCWARGTLHAHPHDHGGTRHWHPHAHARAHPPGEAAAPDPDGPGAEAAHDPHHHRHAEALGRTPLAALGIGLVHGVGGSAAATALLMVAAAGDPARAIALLLGFAVASTAAMAGASAALGAAFGRGPLSRHLRWALPAVGVFGVVFGFVYALAALAPAALV